MTGRTDPGPATDGGEPPRGALAVIEGQLRSIEEWLAAPEGRRPPAVSVDADAFADLRPADVVRARSLLERVIVCADRLGRHRARVGEDLERAPARRSAARSYARHDAAASR